MSAAAPASDDTKPRAFRLGACLCTPPGRPARPLARALKNVAGIAEDRIGSEQGMEKKKRRKGRLLVVLAVAIAAYVASFLLISHRSNQLRWEGYLKHTPRPVKYVVGLSAEWEASMRTALGFRYADDPDWDRRAYYFYWPVQRIRTLFFPNAPSYKRLPLLDTGPPASE